MFASRLGYPRWGNGSLGTRATPPAPVCVAAALTVATLLFSPAIWAQEKDELARRHFESGAAYFAEAEYEDALKAFRKAYELSNRPEILLSIATVEERVGNLGAAIEALNEYLLHKPDDPDIETVRLRRDNLAKRQQAQPAPQPKAVPKPVPTEEESPKGDGATEPAAEGPTRLPAYVVLSLGALSGVGAAITGLGALAEYDDLKERCQVRRCTDEDLANGDTLSLTSTILTGVSVLGIGVGIWLWSASDDDEQGVPPQAWAAPRVNVAVGPGTGFAAARWRF